MARENSQGEIQDLLTESIPQTMPFLSGIIATQLHPSFANYLSFSFVSLRHFDLFAYFQFFSFAVVIKLRQRKVANEKDTGASFYFFSLCPIVDPAIVHIHCCIFIFV
jgi:hypothetical protein